MRIALAQIDTTIGDFDGNLRLIRETARRAETLGADLCCFPEQCLPGYPAHDLLERPLFIQRNLNALDELARTTGEMALLIGFAEPHTGPIGKRLYNSAALLAGGQVVSVHRKSLLPTYDIFDESRYFDPSPEVRPVEWKGVRLGITICEDAWNDPTFWPHRLYDRDPLADLTAAGADILINIAASPFTVEKRSFRRSMLQAAAVHLRRPLLFVNSVGGNDELIFDGASLAFGADGRVWGEGAEFAADLILIDTSSGTGDRHPSNLDDDSAALEALVLGTRDYAQKCGFESAILGLSGGIDSALVAALGARAFGAENVTALLMPSRYSSRGSVEDSEQLARSLGIRTQTIPIDGLFQRYLSDLAPHFAGHAVDTTEENLQARIRGNLLMAFSNKFGSLLLSTGNKSELATGYCTLYGDMAGGLALLTDVPKSMVYRLARLVNRDREVIPEAILTKPPSAELKPDQRDQDTLPPYDLLDDLIDRIVVRGLDREAIVGEGFDPAVVDRVAKLIAASEYKRRQAPIGLKISAKSFGYGRRVPLASKWR